MLPLNDNKWKELPSGYRIPYDASVPLKKLDQATIVQEIEIIFTELWNELHHQGDVDLASYYAVPHIIRIAKEKRFFNWNVFGLVATIEIERHNNNPKLPEEYEAAYLNSIQKELPELIKEIWQDKWDAALASTALAALSVSKGHIEMAAAILKMDDEDLVKEFLENY